MKRVPQEHVGSGELVDHTEIAGLTPELGEPTSYNPLVRSDEPSEIKERYSSPRNPARFQLISKSNSQGCVYFANSNLAFIALRVAMRRTLDHKRHEPRHERRDRPPV
jgi:hypothetical protein